MFINALVARTGYHFSTLCCPAKLRHFFGPLIYQQHDNATLGRAFMYTSYHLFQKNRLTSLRRRDYQLTRTLTYRRYQIYYPHTLITAKSKLEPLMRIDHYHIRKSWPFPKSLWLHPAKRFYRYQPSLTVLSFNLTCNSCPFTKTILPG
jgi:hypothetical protein